MDSGYRAVAMSQSENDACVNLREIRRWKVDVSGPASSRAMATRPWSTFKASCEGNNQSRVTATVNSGLGCSRVWCIIPRGEHAGIVHEVPHRGPHFEVRYLLVKACVELA